MPLLIHRVGPRFQSNETLLSLLGYEVTRVICVTHREFHKFYFHILNSLNYLTEMLISIN